MLYTLIAIRDRSVNGFQPVQATRSEGEAIRGFQDAINNPQSGVMHKHPDDFDLYTIGMYNDETGHIECHTPNKIADGKQLAIQGE